MVIYEPEATMRDFQEQIIAHFSWLKSLLWMFALGIIFSALASSVVTKIYAETLHQQLLFVIASGLVVLLGLWIMLLVLSQLALKAARAVWERDGNLHFLDFYGGLTFSQVPISSIEKLAIGSTRFWRPVGIILMLKGGEKRYMPTILLREKKEAIQLSIEQMLQGSLHDR